MHRGAPGKLRGAAAALYRTNAAPANAFLAALAARNAGNVFECWPENWAAYQLFYSMGTQWSVGVGGRTGLRYESLYPRLDRLAKTPEEWDDLFSDIQEMEYAALEQMNENRQSEE